MKSESLSPTHLLEVSGLKKSFPDGGEIFRDISFTVNHGESVALVGSNGSGKSTLLRCCMRLIEPDCGEIKLFGKSITYLRAKALRQQRAKVGFVFQRHNLVPRTSVLSNVIHGVLGKSSSPRYWCHALAPAVAREHAFHCLSQVGMENFALRRVADLSGGQSQRVAIARALMQKPRMIIADEPAASLDPKAGLEIMELFVRLVREHRLALLFVSHHLDHALHHSDRILVLRDGSLERDSLSSNEDFQSLQRVYG